MTKAMGKAVAPIATTAATGLAWAPSWVLDRAEQVLVVLLWSGLVARVLASSNGHAWLAAASEAAVLVLVLARRPGQAISHRAGDWMMALAATVAPLLIMPAPDLLPRLVPLALALVAG